MSLKRIAILLGILALLGGFYVLDTRRVERKKQKEEEAKKVFGFQPDQVSEISLIRGEDTVTAQRVEEGKWQIIHPIRDRGDKYAIDALARNVAEAGRTRTLEEDADPRSYGLLPPVLQIDVKGADDLHARLLMGDKNPTGQSRYAQVEGQTTIFLLLEGTYSSMNRNLYDLRDKNLLSDREEAYSSVEVVFPGEGPHIVLEKGPEDEWRLTKPLAGRADEERVRTLLSSFKYGRIKEFVDEEPEDSAAYGLVGDATRFVFWSEDGKSSETILIGGYDSAKKGFMARNEGAQNVFLLDANFKEGVNLTLDELRMRSVFDIDSWQVDSVSIVKSGTERVPLVLERDDKGDWQITQPIEAPADNKKIRDLIDRLVDLEVATFHQPIGDLKSVGLDAPLFRVTLAGDGQSNALSLGRGTEDEKEVFAIREGDTEVFSVQPWILEELALGVDDIKKEETAVIGGEEAPEENGD